jgi:hypothetical protein
MTLPTFDTGLESIPNEALQTLGMLIAKHERLVKANKFSEALNVEDEIDILAKEYGLKVTLNLEPIQRRWKYGEESL